MVEDSLKFYDKHRPGRTLGNRMRRFQFELRIRWMTLRWLFTWVMAKKGGREETS